MKPTNYDEPGCDPISSNCVIWQGPDLPCIKLCKGDRVSEVVYKMAVELCEVLDILNVESYNIACLNVVGCNPSSFQTLLQLIIDRICALENLPPVDPGNPAGCPDCVVNIAECFYYQNELGDTITTMQLTDYVTAIGNRICDLVLEIDTINSTLVSLDARITVLENAPAPSLELPSITPACIFESALSLDEFAALLEQEFCLLRSATGTATEIFLAVARQCAGLSEEERLSGSGPMSSIPGWVEEPSTAADTITNMWLTICDMRAAVRHILDNCCDAVCQDLQINLTAALNGDILTVYLSGTIPAGFVPCSELLLYPISIADENGNVLSGFVPAASLNDPAGHNIDLSVTSINTSSNLTISGTICVRDPEGDSQCQVQVSYYLENYGDCPSVVVVPSFTSAGVSANYMGGAANLIFELYDSLGLTLLQTTTQAVIGPGIYNVTFSGLNTATSYRTRVVVNIGDTYTRCPFTAFTTLPGACPAPNNVVAVLQIT